MEKGETKDRGLGEKVEYEKASGLRWREALHSVCSCLNYTCLNKGIKQEGVRSALEKCGFILNTVLGGEAGSQAKDGLRTAMRGGGESLEHLTVLGEGNFLVLLPSLPCG